MYPSRVTLTDTKLSDLYSCSTYLGLGGNQKKRYRNLHVILADDKDAGKVLNELL